MAARINELKQKRIDARRKATEAREKLAAMLEDHGAAAEAEKRFFTSAEKAAQAKLEADLSAAAREEMGADELILAEEKRIEGIKERAVKDPSMRLGDGFGTWPAEDAEPDRPAVGALPALPARTSATLGRLYGDARYSPGASREEFRAVIAAAYGGPPLPAILAATQREGVDSEGGFAVTPDMARGVFTRSFEESLWMRLGVRLETMVTSERDIVAFDDADETDDAEAGLKAALLPDGATSTIQAAKYRRVHLHADNIKVLAAVSTELGEDSPDFVPGLEGALVRAISKKFDRMVLTGAGVSNGILSGPALVTIAKETGQAAATILWANITKAWSRLAPGSHERSVWVAHPTTLPQLLTLSFPIGVAGAQPRQALESDGQGGYLLMSRPVYISSRVKTLGTAGDIILVDPSQVVIGLRRGITVRRSEHALFTQDSLAILASMRACAGQLWNAARTMVSGGSTVSPYVVIADRA